MGSNTGKMVVSNKVIATIVAGIVLLLLSGMGNLVAWYVNKNDNTNSKQWQAIAELRQYHGRTP